MRPVTKWIFPPLVALHGYHLLSGIETVNWMSVAPWLNWSAIWLGMTAIAVYAYAQTVKRTWIWRCALVFILAVDIYQLSSGGLFTSEMAPEVTIFVSINYAILVLPQIFATIALAQGPRGSP